MSASSAQTDGDAPGAWLLWPNLGAEEGTHWPRHASRPAVTATVQLWRSVFPAAHRVLGPIDPGDDAWSAALGPRPAGAAWRWLDARPGAHAWLADAEARRACLAAGAPLAAASSESVRTVHDKAFAERISCQLDLVPPPLRDLTRVLEPEGMQDAEATLREIRGHLDGWPEWTRGRFVLKPRLGTSGRGRVAGRRDAFDPEAIARALPRLAACGGAILQPWLERSADLSVSLVVGAPNDPPDTPVVTLLGSLLQRTTPAGVPLGSGGEIDSRGRVESGHPADESVREAAVEVARAARDVGYSGPLGIDALVFVAPDAEGRARAWLWPVVEVNARFTLGIVTIGVLRRALDVLRGEHGLAPGMRRRFHFGLAPPRGCADWTAAADAAGPGTFVAPLDARGAGSGPGLVVAPSGGSLDALDARP